MLHSLKPSAGSTRARKRVARGNSGKGGSTAGRGYKGQQSRTGKGKKLGFEGGQMPLLLRLPKLGGFRSPSRIEYEVVNLEDLEGRLPAGDHDVASLRRHRIVRSSKPVKLLGNGSISKKMNVTVHAASKSARDAVQKAGGSVRIVRP